MCPFKARNGFSLLLILPDLGGGVSQVYLLLHEGRLTGRTKRECKENVLDETQKVY